MSEEARSEFRQSHEQHEQECRFKAVLCSQTLDMLTYLTSDEIIKVPFLSNEILPRFVSMLSNILNRLVGSKSLELKVENMENYNFEPKELLQNCLLSLLHFSDYPIFHEQVAKDGFYEDGVPLRKAIQTVSRLAQNKSIQISIEQINELKQLEQKVSVAKSSVQVFALFCMIFCVFHVFLLGFGLFNS